MNKLFPRRVARWSATRRSAAPTGRVDPHAPAALQSAVGTEAHHRSQRIRAGWGHAAFRLPVFAFAACLSSLIPSSALADQLGPSIAVTAPTEPDAAEPAPAEPVNPAATNAPRELKAPLSPPEIIDQMHRDIEYLASDQLRGRSAVDDSIELAADYVAQRMAAVGLDTHTIDNGPLQPFSVPLGARAGPAEHNRVVFESSDDDSEPIVASLDDGMNPLAIGSTTGQVEGPVVFAGYGITAPKLDYDDYSGVNANGAVVIVLRKEPGVNDPQSPFNGTRNTNHAFFRTKINNAIRHGASAIILVNDPASVTDDVQQVEQRIQQEKARLKRIDEQLQQLPESAANSRQTLIQKRGSIESMIRSLQVDLAETKRGIMEVGVAGQRPDDRDSIPVVSIARDIIDDVLQKSIGQSLESLEATINRQYKPASAALSGITTKLSVALEPTEAKTSNVVGVLPGKGPLADQTIIVGAHYDHVGMGGFGSLAPGTIAVHNGADDNASGTVAMLAIAAKLRAALQDKPSHRRVVFIAFSAEERGLLGSKHYVRHPLYSLDSTAAMVNLDMVGRLHDNELTVYGTGTADRLDELVTLANKESQFDLYKVPSGYGPSDHQSFYEAGIPVLFFFTGLHNDYHRPSDDIDKINFNGMARITDMVSQVTLELATQTQRLRYAETNKRVRIRRQLTAFMGISMENRGDQVVITQLASDGPAKDSGLKVGDRLKKLGDRDISSSRDVLEFMRTRSPGDSVDIEAIRDGATIHATIKLIARPE